MSAIAAPLPSTPRSVYPRVMPLPPSSPAHWTVAEFHRVRSTGVWDGRRTYLVRGVIWEQGPMNPPHAALVKHVEEVLAPVFGSGYCFRAQVPLLLGQDTDPFPDLAVVTGRTLDYLTVHPTSAHLVVEVADTSLDEDTSTKAELYAAGGIADYWVLDVNARRLLVFRDPRPFAGTTTYRTKFTLSLTDSIAPLALASASIRVSELLP
jgi:Uma2 family endonuclease